ncbi:hypothetical protein BGW38_000347 [Lunasporangiospora selenospora]|uniref:Large ribosomal subunit protein bL32m n=1 Tax=Lunasporangiospora selenospora TaxID=979761 RepID=A0A9P6FVN3_9FUNG|nr:hypothetical protein BGW38_000347 [Lunasporangiospora selenospora]
MSLLKAVTRASSSPSSNFALIRAFSASTLSNQSAALAYFNTNNATMVPASSSATASSTLLSSPASIGISTTILGRLGSYISDLLPSIVWASVPKSKTSHSKKRMRQATKGLKEKHNIVQCPGCGNSKMMHHLCSHCYKDMKGRPSSRIQS